MVTQPPNASGAPLFIEMQPGDELAALARRRGMAVAALELSKLPVEVRARALRDLVPRLRQVSGAKRVLAHGAGAAGAALAETATLFDGLLLQDVDARAPAGKTPRIIETWGADVYWRASPRPAPGGPEPQNKRSFYLAGTAAPAATSANCAAPANARSGAPALRALLVALDEWTKGVKPPASRAPGAADLTPARTLLWPKGAGFPAAPAGERLVPIIDADGNDLSGLRLPDQALPIASFIGFNAQKDKNGACCAPGAALPFAATKLERKKSGDSRLSLTERYGSRAYFVATMRVVADKLVKERLLLPQDADAYVAAAKTAPF